MAHFHFHFQNLPSSMAQHQYPTHDHDVDVVNGEHFTYDAYTHRVQASVSSERSTARGWDQEQDASPYSYKPQRYLPPPATDSDFRLPPSNYPLRRVSESWQEVFTYPLPLPPQAHNQDEDVLSPTTTNGGTGHVRAGTGMTIAGLLFAAQFVPASSTNDSGSPVSAAATVLPSPATTSSTLWTGSRETNKQSKRLSCASVPVSRLLRFRVGATDDDLDSETETETESMSMGWSSPAREPFRFGSASAAGAGPSTLRPAAAPKTRARARKTAPTATRRATKQGKAKAAAAASKRKATKVLNPQPGRTKKSARTQAQRIHDLQVNPYVKQFGAHHVICAACNTRKVIDSRPRNRFYPWSFEKHVRGCKEIPEAERKAPIVPLLGREWACVRVRVAREDEDEDEIVETYVLVVDGVVQSVV
uniref:Uncharacterized protein n=1 Tax=Mycena chlorophos TaxID=658473 RepID=A0ABQ0LLB3_MYCCL|nr:predicted protein [Mycena chlorophos]